MATNEEIDMIIEMVGEKVSIADVQQALEIHNGDTSKAVDELFSLVEVKKIQQQDLENELCNQSDDEDKSTILQWELFEQEMGLKWKACQEILAVFRQQNNFDESSSAVLMEELYAMMDDEYEPEQEDHPLQLLQKQYPHIAMDVIQVRCVSYWQ